MTPRYRFHPPLLVPVGVNRTRPSGLHKAQATAELKQAIAETTHLHCAARRDRRGIFVKIAMTVTYATCYFEKGTVTRLKAKSIL